MNTKSLQVNVDSNISSKPGSNSIEVATPAPLASLDPAASPPSAPTSVELKFRARSFASKLTVPQVQQLLGWLSAYSVADVRALVAQPPPDGFGIEVHDMTLRRFR